VSSSNRDLQILPLEDLVKTGPVDLAVWNYRPVLGWIQRLRFRLVLALLPSTKGRRLLEVGYGSGVFLRELARHTEEVFGIDIHERVPEVTAVLARHGVLASLVSGSVESLPFPDAHFDRIVAVSSLEFVDDLDAACRELHRVLSADGSFVVVTPGQSPLIDAGLRFLTGRSAEGDFAGRRERILPTLARHFTVDAERHFPPLVPGVRLYTALRLRRKG